MPTPQGPGRASPRAWLQPRCAGSVRRWRPSPAPSRAGRCPSRRRPPGPGPTGGAGRRGWRPSRAGRAAQARCCRAGRRRRARQRRRHATGPGWCGSGVTGVPSAGRCSSSRWEWAAARSARSRQRELLERPRAALGRDCSPASASWSAAARRRAGRGGRARPSYRWREEQLPLGRKPLGKSPLSGTSCHWSRKPPGRRQSGFHTALGVTERCWTLQCRSPATALPWVPSTWNSTSSSRLTRTDQEELICATCRLPARRSP